PLSLPDAGRRHRAPGHPGGMGRPVAAGTRQGAPGTFGLRASIAFLGVARRAAEGGAMPDEEAPRRPAARRPPCRRAPSATRRAGTSARSRVGTAYQEPRAIHREDAMTRSTAAPAMTA